MFFSDKDRVVFLRHLGEACSDNRCGLHAFVLMTNHVHLLATGYSGGAISLTMRDVGRRYVQYFNGEYERTGTLYEGRFKSSLVETTRYFLTCMRYIELNPVRAGIVTHPADYSWSSFCQNASGDPSGLVVAHAEYLQLGANPRNRGEAYRRLFDEAIGDDQLAAIRNSAQKSRALGSEAYCDALEATLAESVRAKPQGRPAKGRSVPFADGKGT